jgi:hypothetical protein
MRKNFKLWMMLLIIGLAAAGCQKNYYSGKARSSDCGCPNKKGMVGY